MGKVRGDFVFLCAQFIFHFVLTLDIALDFLQHPFLRRIATKAKTYTT